MKEASSKKPSRIVKPGVKRDIIFDFKPKVFPLIATQEAHDFISSQKQGSSDFKIADMVAEQAGIANLQKQGLENKIEELVLEKLKDVQEGAYKSAYDLGLEEGKKEAYLQNEKIIFERLEKMDALLNGIENIKSNLLVQNEKQLLDLVVKVASLIAINEIDKDNYSIEKSLDLILNDIQSNEELTLYISESDIENINELKLKTGKRSEELKRIRIETRDGLQKGGCILESNYGIMDASIEQRVNKVRGTLLERLPHVDSVKITENHHLNDQGLSVEVHEDELNQENDPKDDES